MPGRPRDLSAAGPSVRLRAAIVKHVAWNELERTDTRPRAHTGGRATCLEVNRCAVSFQARRRQMFITPVIRPAHRRAGDAGLPLPGAGALRYAR